jgi:hypothetical protein
MHWSDYCDMPFHQYLTRLVNDTIRYHYLIKALSTIPATSCVCGQLLRKRIDDDDNFYWHCASCGFTDYDEMGRPATLRQLCLRRQGIDRK